MAERPLGSEIQTGMPSIFLYHNQKTALPARTEYVRYQPPLRTEALNLISANFHFIEKHSTLFPL